MSRFVIVEGNNNDKDNVRAIMVKGEKGDKGDNGEVTYSDVVDNLTTTSSQLPLSANQGKVLKDLVDTLSDTKAEKSDVIYEWNLYQPYLQEEMGTCVLIQDKNTNILYDCGYTGQDTLIQNYLTSKNVTHIDILFISHFHRDHAGCISTILNNYCDANTKIYIGIIPNYSSFVADESTSEAIYNNFVSLCNALGLTYTVPTNNSVVVYDNVISMRFLNTDTTNLTDYYSSYSDTNLTDYQKSNLNNCSLVVELSIYDNKILLTGDVEVTAQEKIKDYIKHVDVLMIPHHNWNRYGSMEFFDNTSCDFAFSTRGTIPPQNIPYYFSRYTHDRRQIRNVQNLETEIKITSTNGFIQMEGVNMTSCYDDITQQTLNTILPGVENCNYDKVDLFDYTLWDSAYIFGLWDLYRKPISTLFAISSANPVTGLQTELSDKFGLTTANYQLNIDYRFMDINRGTDPYDTKRIFRNPTNEYQKYVSLKHNIYSNVNLTGADINSVNISHRPKIKITVSDDDTSNTYTLEANQNMNSLDSSEYSGTFINQSSGRYLTFVGLKVTFNSTGYTINNYFRTTFDITGGTVSTHSTNPAISEVRI